MSAGASVPESTEQPGIVVQGPVTTPDVTPASSAEDVPPVVTESSFDNYTQLSDPFLVLVNAQVALPENWTVELVDSGYQQVDARIYDDITAMFEAAAADGISLWVESGYRDVFTQQVILDRAVGDNEAQGMGYDDALATALRSIASPGHSEHHTGLTADINDVNWDFDETEEYAWLSQHAEEYGFVQRYRADKFEITGIDDEPWHYRYVGKQNAQKMKELDMCLEEYVLYLKSKGVQ